MGGLSHVDSTQSPWRPILSSDPFDRIEYEFSQQLLHKSVTQAQCAGVFDLSQRVTMDLSRTLQFPLAFPLSMPLHMPSNMVEVPSNHQADLVLGSSTTQETPSQELNAATAQVLHALSNLCPSSPQGPSTELPCVPRLSLNNFRSPSSTPPPSPPSPQGAPVPSTASSVSLSQLQEPVAPSNNRRRRLTMDETEYLLAQFCKNEKPNTTERLVFAEHLNLHPRTIQVWFQNRRAKLKRDDSLARALYPQLDETVEVDDDEYAKNGLEQQRTGCVGQLGNIKNGDVDELEGMEDGKHYNEEGIESAQVGTETLASKVEDRDNDGNQDSFRGGQSLATIAKEKLGRRDDASHRGTGTETFIGCERSDAELEWLLGTGSEQSSMSFWERLNLSTCLPSSASGCTDKGNANGTSNPHNDEANGGENDEEDGVKYCDMAALDLGLDLMYEFVFGNPSDPLARGEVNQSGKGVVGSNDDGVLPPSEPSLTELGKSPSTSTVPSKVNDLDKDRNADRVQDAKGRHFANKTINRVSGPKAEKRPYPIQSSRPSDRSRPAKTPGPKHPSLLLRRHNPIPRHQMALTLIPLTDGETAASLDTPR